MKKLYIFLSILLGISIFILHVTSAFFTAQVIKKWGIENINYLFFTLIFLIFYIPPIATLIIVAIKVTSAIEFKKSKFYKLPSKSRRKKLKILFALSSLIGLWFLWSSTQCDPMGDKGIIISLVLFIPILVAGITLIIFGVFLGILFERTRWIDKNSGSDKGDK